MSSVFRAWLPSPFFITTLCGTIAGIVASMSFSVETDTQIDIKRALAQSTSANAPTAISFRPTTRLDPGGLIDAPLFSPIRRPTSEKKQDSAYLEVEPELLPDSTLEELDSAPPATPDVVFLGVLIADKKRLALIRDTRNSTERWIAEGDSYEQWTLSSISDEELLFVSGDHEFAIRFRE